MNENEMNITPAADHNIARFNRLEDYALKASRFINGSLCTTAENAEENINVVKLSVPKDTEIDKVAMHYVYRAAYASDKFVPTAGVDGSTAFLFYVDMASPYV